jgi:hypothetical protein
MINLDNSDLYRFELGEIFDSPRVSKHHVRAPLFTAASSVRGLSGP